MNSLISVVLFACAPTLVFATPFPREDEVTRNQFSVRSSQGLASASPELGSTNELTEEPGLPTLRVQVDWSEGEHFAITEKVREFSGTLAFRARAPHRDPLGSYQARLVDSTNGAVLAWDSVGTGKEFRHLARGLTFRFPLPEHPVEFELFAENPETGIQQSVLRERIDPSRDLRDNPAGPADLEIRVLKTAGSNEKLQLNLYAEGYATDRKEAFFVAADRVLRVLTEARFPLLEKLEIRAVFSRSAERLGPARDLGLPVPERDSFLGLYFPYWNGFGRWYHVVYPTREHRFRSRAALVPYDYAFAIVDDDRYWGVGNYRELTAIPGDARRFDYLLLHEFGHFFGLNEEYDEGGRTELEFAPGINEPWSQNITFHSASRADLKWSEFVADSTPVPTPSRLWRANPPFYGAYSGGYAESEPRGHSHKPGLNCVMDRYANYCDVCRAAIRRVLQRDLGAAAPEPGTERFPLSR